MTESRASDSRLKGSVRYGRTLPLGGARVLTIEWSEEFYLDEMTVEEATFNLESKMKRALQDAGIVR